MTSHASTTAKPETNKTPLWTAAEANELGQISGLEAHATYFVVRKPTQELTKERSRELVEEVRGFVHEQRVLAERQVKELQDKYGEPAKARAMELRTTLEKRFDELAKEIESRIEKIETDLGERGILKAKKVEGHGLETPGEMPTGGNGAAETAEAAKPKKKNAKKDE